MIIPAQKKTPNLTQHKIIKFSLFRNPYNFVCVYEKKVKIRHSYLFNSMANVRLCNYR